MNEAEFQQQLEAANRRGLEASVREVRAVSVRFDSPSGNLVLGLRGGPTLLVPARLLQGVAGVSPNQIARVEVVADGSALRFETLDADFAVQDIAAGSFGTRAWMQHLEDIGALNEASTLRRRQVDKLLGLPTASNTGRKGNDARTAATRANGDRPRKKSVAA